MAIVTVVRSPFRDAMHVAEPVSLDETYPDGHLVNEYPDQSDWGADPALKYERKMEDESPLPS